MKNAQGTYLDVTTEKLRNFSVFQKEVLGVVSLKIFESLQKGGVWNLFGSGHSHMAVEEAFHRAGGLIPVNPWLEEYLMPHAGPSRNGPFERLPGLAQIIFNFYKPRVGEVLTLISNSGINPMSVEMAMIAREVGVVTVAITNLEHSKSSESRHPSKKKLFELCDHVIDTGGVAGDAVLNLDHQDVAVAPLSGILSCFAVNSILIGVVDLYAKAGLKAPVYLSANVKGGDERNRTLEAQYKGRISRLQ